MSRSPEGNWVRTVLLVILGTTTFTVVGFCCVCGGMLSLSKDRTQRQVDQAVATQLPPTKAEPRIEPPPPPEPPAEAPPKPEEKPIPAQPPVLAPPKEEKPPEKEAPKKGTGPFDNAVDKPAAYPVDALAMLKTPRSSFTKAFRNEESRKAGRYYGVLNGEAVRVVAPGPEFTRVVILTGTYADNTADVPSASLTDIPPPKPRYSAGYTQAELDQMAQGAMPIAIPAIGGAGGRGTVQVQGYYRNGRWVSGYTRSR